MTVVGAEVALLVDTGSVWTKAAVVGRSRGRWRIVSHASQPTAWSFDELRYTLAEHLRPSADRRVVDALEQLLADAPRIECHTAARPGRLALAAVSRELSATAARRAAESAGWLVAESVTIDDGRSAIDRLAALQAADVDAWLLAGGFDDAPAEGGLEVAALVAAARQAWGGPVIWAGSKHLADAVEELFEGGAVTVVGNPRPSRDVEDGGPLRAHLEELLRSTVEPESAIHLAPISFRRAIRELSRSSGLRVLGIDLGAQYATRVLADGEGGAESRVFAAGGLTSPALTVTGAPARVARIMSQPIDDLAVADILQNLRARPSSLPHTEDELAVVQAAARHQLSQLAADDAAGGGIDLLVGAGRVLAAAPHPGQAAQMLLDGARPLGVTQLAIDVANALDPLGALDDDEIEEGVGSLRDDLLVPLGTAVVCRGGRAGEAAMRVSLHRTGWPAIGPIEVRSGQLRVLPLGRGQVAELEIVLEEGVSLGVPRRGRQVRVEVTGGSVGVLLDARGVPISLPRRSDDRRAVLAGWRDVFAREASLPATRTSTEVRVG